MATRLTAEDLLAGSGQTHAVVIPADVMPAGAGAVGGEVLLRPLTVADVQRIGKATRDQGVLASVLMVQQALVDPDMTIDQVGALPAGLARFLLAEVNKISGLALSEDDLHNAVKAPLTRATFVLAREFGWSPSQCSELTVGQVLLYLEMLAGGSAGGDRENAA